jgi:hypothetical protein
MSRLVLFCCLLDECLCSSESMSWGEKEITNIRETNHELYQSEIGQKMLRMLRHFQGGDRTGPHADSPIWILELLQNAIDAKAKTLRIYHIEGQGFLITHDNFRRNEKGMMLNELSALCNISTTTKSLTSVGFFGIGFNQSFTYLNVFYCPQYQLLMASSTSM